MGTPSFLIYVDESGDEGFVFKGPSEGSSHWFILSAVITRKHLDIETVKLVDTVRQQLNRPLRQPLHFRRMKHGHRLPYIDKIAQAQLRTVSILVHKPSLKEPETFREKYRLYFYAVRYLLERVSWFCRDHRQPQQSGDGSARVIFSNRAGMSYDQLCEYLNLLKRRSDLGDVRIDWSVINPDNIRAIGHEKLMGLQIADAVASSFYCGVQNSPQGFTEPRYAQMLKPVVYQDKGRYLGYGVKFWPRDAMALIQQEGNLAWVNQTYQ